MKTIYTIIGGGQRIRENIQKGKPVYFSEVNNSDWPEKAKCEGQDSFTNTIWATDLESLERWANDWAGKKIRLTRCD